MVRQFTPSEETTRDFRDALGCFATGVTIVTAPSETGGIGMTANSFSAISLNPPLVLWSPSKTSLRFPFFEKADQFAIHVLAVDQKDLAMDFAKRGDAFDKVDMRLNAYGVPIFDACIARFECTTTTMHDAGDHAIMVGRVEHAYISDGTPLIFAQSQYGAMTPRG